MILLKNDGSRHTRYNGNITEMDFVFNTRFTNWLINNNKFQRPLRESNPCSHRERAITYTFVDFHKQDNILFLKQIIHALLLLSVNVYACIVRKNYGSPEDTWEDLFEMQD